MHFRVLIGKTGGDKKDFFEELQLIIFMSIHKFNIWLQNHMIEGQMSLNDH